MQRDKWQAPCFVPPAGIAIRTAWGDNLTGDAKLKVGSPIRVELVLSDVSGAALDTATQS